MLQKLRESPWILRIDLRARDEITPRLSLEPVIVPGKPPCEIDAIRSDGHRRQLGGNARQADRDATHTPVSELGYERVRTKPEPPHAERNRPRTQAEHAELTTLASRRNMGRSEDRQLRAEDGKTRRVHNDPRDRSRLGTSFGPQKNQCSDTRDAQLQPSSACGERT